MSIFFRGRPAEERAITGLPWVAGGPRPSVAAGVEGSLALVPVFACTRLIAEAIASLPLQSFRKTVDGREPIPLPKVLATPSAYGTRMEWVQRALMSLLLRGNAYGLKTGYDPATTGYGAIEWLNPDKVKLLADQRTWTYDGREVPNDQLLHIPGLVLPGHRLGISPLKSCRLAVEAGLSAQQFTRDWYENRAVPGVTFKNTEKVLKPEEATTVKERMIDTIRSGEPFVTGSDWELDVLKLSADDAGFVQAAKLTATQVATIYGVPPEMVGGETGASLTYSTTEQQQIQFLTHTLRPWVTRLEAAFSDLLPSPRYVRFNVDALIRVDTKTRWEIHEIGRDIGATNIDEIRALEEMPPLPDGKGQDYTALAIYAKTTKESR